MAYLLSFLSLLVVVVTMAFSVVVAAATTSSSSSTFASILKTASFVPPASPAIASSSPAPTDVVHARHEAAIQGYGTSRQRHSSYHHLWAKKKRSSPTSAAAKSKKIQVKLLKYVSGTGSAGDVVRVTPAFFNNKLRPTKSAVPITDDEIEAEQSERRAQIQANDAAATKIKERLEQDDFSLVIERKTGPDGQLFGAVSSKVILNNLRENVSDEYLNQSKQVKIVQVTQDGKKMRGDIKHVGDYGVDLALTKDIRAKFEVSVKGES